MASSDAMAFALIEAVKEGLLDRHLDKLLSEVKWRQGLLDPSKPPRKTAEMRLSGHQNWAWMAGADPPQWQVVGTGLLLDAPSKMLL